MSSQASATAEQLKTLPEDFDAAALDAIPPAGERLLLNWRHNLDAGAEPMLIADDATRDACTALACLNRDLPVFHYGVLAFGGPVRCAPYVSFGTPALATLAAEAMAGRTACLLANHGMITAGATLAAAVDAAFELERLARQYLLACAAGTPRLLTEAEIAEAQARLVSYQKGA